MLKLAFAIALLWTSPNRVQVAIDSDVCKNESMMDSTARGAKLKGRDAKSYKEIRQALGQAYESASEPTDGELESIRSAFCDAVDNR